MEILLDRHLYNALYNCTMYRVEDVSFERRQNLPFGIIMIVLYCIFVPLHVLCLGAMREFWANSSAYKVMFLMGLGHICGLSVTALLTGIFALRGIVFCSAPALIFIAGQVALFGWAFTTSLSLLLALERCVEQTFPHFAAKCFGGPRILLWSLAVLAYSLYYGFFTMPLTFSGITANWQFNPHVGYLQDDQFDSDMYWNNVDAIHTIVVATALPSLYILFTILLSLKLTQIAHLTATERKMRKSVFVQVFVLSLVLTVFSLNYTLLNYVPVPDILVSVNMYLWVLLDGVPPIVYLTLNDSIREECVRILRRNPRETQRIRPATNNHRLNNGWTAPWSMSRIEPSVGGNQNKNNNDDNNNLMMIRNISSRF